MPRLRGEVVTELTAAEAAQLLRVGIKTVRKMWRAGILRGRMQTTIGGRSRRLLIDRASVDKRLADEARTPLDLARRGLPAA